MTSRSRLHTARCSHRVTPSATVALREAGRSSSSPSSSSTRTCSAIYSWRLSWSTSFRVFFDKERSSTHGTSKHSRWTYLVCRYLSDARLLLRYRNIPADVQMHGHKILDGSFRSGLSVIQEVWAQFDPSRSGTIGLHYWRKFLRTLKSARSPLATKAHYIAWERPIYYEAWHCHSPNKGLQFADALLILLHDKFGRQVSCCPHNERLPALSHIIALRSEYCSLFVAL